jgi:hypothetical protein
MTSSREIGSRLMAGERFVSFGRIRRMGEAATGAHGHRLRRSGQAAPVWQGNVHVAVPDRHPGRAFLISATSTERPRSVRTKSVA